MFESLQVGLLYNSRKSAEVYTTLCGLQCNAVLEGMLGVIVIVNGWAFILRLLHALSGASIYFLVLEKSAIVAVNDFGGIFIVTLLLLLGASACNYILLGMEPLQAPT